MIAIFANASSFWQDPNKNRETRRLHCESKRPEKILHKRPFYDRSSCVSFETRNNKSDSKRSKMYFQPLQKFIVQHITAKYERSILASVGDQLPQITNEIRNDNRIRQTWSENKIPFIPTIIRARDAKTERNKKTSNISCQGVSGNDTKTPNCLFSNVRLYTKLTRIRIELYRNVQKP